MKFSPFLLGSLAFAIPSLTASATTYSGNGLAGFGGSVGNGVLTITSNNTAGTVTFSEAPGNSGSFGAGNALVLYIDSKSGGFADTSTFTDNGDGERIATSGFNLSNSSSRTVATFPTGFTADYAIAFDSGNPAATPAVAGNINGYSLVGNGAFGFLANNTSAAAPFALTLTFAQLGLTSTSRFTFVGTLLSETAFRSNEAIGTITPATASGFTAPITFTSLNTFLVPEPGSIAGVALGLAVLGGLARRRSQCSA